MDTKLIDQFKTYMHGKVSDGTLNIYVHGLEQFFVSMNGNALTSEFAQAYVDQLNRSGMAPNTVCVRAHAIMNLFKMLKRPVRLDCPSIIMKKPEYLKMDEVEKVIATCKTQLERTLVVMLFDTAVRISELLKLELKEIDWHNKTITVVRKGGRITEVNMSDKAVKELQEWIRMRDSKKSKVFEGLDYYTAWQIIKAMGKRAGIPLHPHIFRHSRAISMLKSGAKPYVVQQHLGHKSLATTMNIYGMFMATDLREEIPQW